MKHNSTLPLVGIIGTKGTFFNMTLIFGKDEAYAGILTALGLPAEKVTELAGVDDAKLKDFKPDDYVTAIRTGLETNFLNSPEFLAKIGKDKIPEAVRKDIESGQYGRFMNEAKDFISKKLGVDLSDLTEKEATSLQTVLQKFAEKHAGKLGGTDAAKTLQIELTKALQEKAELETNSKTILEKAIADEQGKTSSLLQKLLTQNELGNIQGLKVKPGFIVDAILAKASSLYTLKLEGTEMVVKRKDNPALDVTGADGKVKSFADVIAEITKAEDLVNKTETAEEKAAREKKEKEGEGKVKVEVEGNEFKLPANIASKIEQNTKLESSAASGK